MVALALVGQPAGASHTVVTDHDGLSFGYFTDVRVFGGPAIRLGFGQNDDAPLASDDTASPSAACPQGNGSVADVDPDSSWDADSDPADGSSAKVGPAVLFGGVQSPASGPLTTTIDCRRGPEGHVTASASVTPMPEGATYDVPDDGLDPIPHIGGVGAGAFRAAAVHSRCTMTATGSTVEVAIEGGIVVTHAQAQDHDPGIVFVPPSPEPNTVIEGHIHLGPDTQENFRVIFNEQVHNDDGSLTVNAVHVELLGPSAVGDVVVASSTCGPLSTVPGARSDHP